VRHVWVLEACRTGPDGLSGREWKDGVARLRRLLLSSAKARQFDREDQGAHDDKQCNR
jgi:hypothetical protein